MSERPNPGKRANQTLRAQKLVGAFIVKMEALGEQDRQAQAEVARLAKTFVWDALGEELGFDHPPSSETIAMAVAMMKGRAQADATFHRRTHGNFKQQHSVRALTERARVAPARLTPSPETTWAVCFGCTGVKAQIVRS